LGLEVGLLWLAVCIQVFASVFDVFACLVFVFVVLVWYEKEGGVGLWLVSDVLNARRLRVCLALQDCVLVLGLMPFVPRDDCCLLIAEMCVF